MTLAELNSLTLRAGNTERVNQRYEIEETSISYLFNRPAELSQELESSLTSTTLHFLCPEQLLEQLCEEHSLTVEKRIKLLNLPFLFLRPKQRKQLKVIDQKLDSLEFEIAGMRREQLKRETKAIEGFIEDNERWIQNFVSKINLRK